MRNLILQLLKNQRYLFITVFGGLIILFTSWYFLVQKGLSKEHKRSSNARIVLEKDVDKFRRMESQIIGLEAEWNDINSQFDMTNEEVEIEEGKMKTIATMFDHCLLYTSPSPRDQRG